MRISIITVALNNRDTIEATLRSVLTQTHRNTEYIVIDGGSNDGTRELLESYRHEVTTIISEPDNGIYDAMNKGIAMASGDIIGLLNADDIYASDDVLTKINCIFSGGSTEACYGDLCYIDSQDKNKILRYWKSGCFERRKLYFGWMPPHPTFFVRKHCYDRYGTYRTDLGSSADYELMLRYMLKYLVCPTYVPGVLVHMQTGGMSNASVQQRLHAHLMDWRAWQVNGLRPFPWTVLLKPIRKIHQWFFVSTEG